MKTHLLVILAFLGLNISAQTANNKIDFKFGIGQTFLGSGDKYALSCENELSYKLNHFFSTSVSLGFGKSNNGIIQAIAFYHENLNIYFSPFTNAKKHDLKIGAGISNMNISNLYMSRIDYDNNYVTDIDYYGTYKKSTIGYNIILEDDISLSDRFILGIKAFVQPYIDGDVNSSLQIRFGIKL
jgi:hypothetical protein